MLTATKRRFRFLPSDAPTAEELQRLREVELKTGIPPRILNGRLPPFDPTKIVYDYVDIGCGRDAGDIIHRAKMNPGKRFLGIDPRLSAGTLEAAKGLSNLELRRDDAVTVLSALPMGSVSVATCTYLLNNLRPVDKEPKERDEFNQLAKVLRKALWPYGIFFSMHSDFDDRRIREAMNLKGFKVLAPSISVPDEEAGRTHWLRLHKRHGENPVVLLAEVDTGKLKKWTER